MRYLILTFLVVAGPVWADARQVDGFHWDGVERIVAIGDLHGDYDHYVAALEAAGLVDRKGRWSGGDTHLVQTGDIPDRGPDTGRIIEHLQKLGKQAQRKGGFVHNLIGNHEAMNVYGDLRYVHEGEYEALVTRKSEALRDRYFDLYLQSLKESAPEEFAQLPGDFRDKWNLQYPLGWVEHRQAWDPAWNPEGEYATWVFGNKVAVQVNDAIFLHGGISGFYCQNSLASLTEKVTAALRQFDPQAPGILVDEYGPLWYRGLAGEKPAAPVETVDAILAHHGARRIVIGHTPTSGVIWPRYDGKVILIDTGISEAYGGHVAYLELTPQGVFAGYRGGKLALPQSGADRLGYLEKVAELNPENPSLARRLQAMREPPAPAAEAADAEPDFEADAEAGPAEGAAEGGEAPPPAPAPEPVPVCSVTP